ncbi:MAG: hypothetical protein ACOYJQ_10010 [Pseudochelatococcus sp.]|jgi:hypothetical protein|uniref:hypothetical protein n=1 Tax=Pseudochelatococcus sp. TaxID=2020869 RepID=UPI003D931C8E
MTVLEQVRDFIVSRSPRSVCDDCVTTALGLSVRQHANHKTRELAAAPVFERRKNTCSICGAAKMVISYTPSIRGGAAAG